MNCIEGPLLFYSASLLYNLQLKCRKTAIMISTSAYFYH